MVAVLHGAIACVRLLSIGFLLLVSSVSVPVSADAVRIFGTPSTEAVVGQLYRFRAAAVPVGSVLFAAVNVPSWATFDPKLGQLQGVPSAADVGGFGNIRIFASYAGQLAVLPAFAIQVRSPTASGSVSFQWDPPTQNEDGSVLTDLAGYRIYSGSSVSELAMRISVPNPGLTRYFIDSLASGQHFFAVTAVNAAGAESKLSPIALVLIP
jgi:hypothetical protein